MAYFLTILPAFYLVLLAFLAVLGLHRLTLALRYFFYSSNNPSPKALFARLPKVTVQLPLYNESAVARRLIDSVTALNYPNDLLEIQVLDDSTDETSEIVSTRVDYYRSLGVNVRHLRRPHRDGFKAGALAFGLSQAEGEFVAVFDSDFLPHPEYLMQSIHYFADPKVGMVQMRWGYLNVNDSWLTRAQATLLDGHFQIEHMVRHRAGLFFNFNGTAGIWRATAIAKAGGWQGDTLTEDLDLSYRAQLAGEHFVYLVENQVPSELPTAIDAFKSQQHRWTTGAIEVLKKLFLKILSSKQPFYVKLESFFHLGSNFCHPVLLLAGLLILPVIEISFDGGLLANEPSGGLVGMLDRAALSAGLLSVLVFYFIAVVESKRGSHLSAVIDVLIALVVAVGLCFSNTVGVLEALIGRKNDFNRTPKTGDANTAHLVQGQVTERKGWRCWLVYAEGLLSLYFVLAIGRSVYLGSQSGMLFAVLFASAFGYHAVLGWFGCSPRSTKPCQIREDEQPFFVQTPARFPKRAYQ